MGLTKIRAGQISNIDYKQSCRALTATNITLSGGAPNSVDSVNLSAGNRILVIGQTNKSQNGIYIVQTLGTGSNGTWVRSRDTDVTGEIEAGMIVMVTEGTVYKDTQWKLITNDPITVGTTELIFELNSAFAFGNIYANGTAVLANVVGDAVTFAAGDNVTIVGNTQSQTITFSVQVGNVATTEIASGTSNVRLISSGGNAVIGVAGIDNIGIFSTQGLSVTGIMSATGNITGGNLSGTNVTGTLTTAEQTNITSVGTLSSLSVSGNVQGGNLRTAGLISATGNIFCGNLSATGNVTAKNIDSVNADLAELYIADQEYLASTVVVFGGDQEITQSTQYADPRVAGVISTAPAYTMNSSAGGLPVALQGRVPCRVVGQIAKGDLITSSYIPGVATRLDPQNWQPGAVIGKALENYNNEQEGIIEVVVGRL